MSTIRPAKLEESLEGSILGDGLGSFFQCGIILVDAQDHLSVFTNIATRLLVSNGERSRPQTLRSLPTPLQTLIAEARSNKLAILDRMVDLTDPAKGELVLRVSVLPIASEKSNSVTIVLQDMGAARRFEKHLRQLDRLASFATLSVGMAHEIKNALVVGKTFFDLLLEKHQDAELVHLVRRELTRVDALVTQMLRFNAPARPALAELQVHEVLNHSLLMVKRQIEDKSIQLESLYTVGSDWLQGDEFQLEQSFVNLLLNAIEAMGPHGRLTVATRSGLLDSVNDPHLDSTRSGQLQITIQDSGIGIPPENLGRLFDPFFTTKSGGTGLGLFITRRIIEEHGGQISVQSEPNKGTRFQILLPLLDSV